MSSVRDKGESGGNSPCEGFRKKEVVELGAFCGLLAAPLAVCLAVLLAERPAVSVREVVRGISAANVLEALGGVFVAVELVRLARRSLPGDPGRRRKAVCWFFAGFAIPFFVLAGVVLAFRFL